MKMNRAAIPAALLAGGLLAGCSTGQVPEAAAPPIATASQTPETAMPPTTTATRAPIESEPKYINAGKDENGDVLLITELTQPEKLIYDRAANPQAASLAALKLGCNAINLVRSDRDRSTEYGSPLTQDYDLYNRARDVYEFAEYQTHTLTTSTQFADNLTALGCIMPERPSAG